MWAAMSAVSVLNVSGTTQINANISTTGNQTVHGCDDSGHQCQLGSQWQQRCDCCGQHTVDGDTAATRTLNISATGTGAKVVLGGAVGTVNLSALSVTASAIDLNATTVTTSGNQTYAGAVTLGANTNITASNLITTANSTIAGGGFSLNVTGNDVIGGAISGVNVLNISGTTSLGANVSTTGSQTYAGAITLAGDAVLAATNASSVITVGSTLNSDATPDNLTINASGTSGSVVLNGALGKYLCARRC
jgi:hypothetical protein